MKPIAAARPVNASAPAPAPRPAVEIAGLHKSFGAHPVLRGVDLTVPAQSVTAILGPSGSGKTTLLRVLAGFLSADAGTISIDGRQVDGPRIRVRPEARRVGYVPQEGSLFPHVNVRANIGFGVPRSRRRARVEELIELIDLGDLADRYPHQLSGGQQQRVAVARALAPEPSLILLDEPFSALDAFLRSAVRLDVARILREAGTTTVLVTHDQDEALSIADQIAVLRDGEVAQLGSPQTIYTRPVDSALARFIGEANLLPGVIRGGAAHTVFGPLPLCADTPTSADGSVLVLIRPEQIELCEHLSHGAVTGTVLRLDYHGHDSMVTVDIPGAERINVRCVNAASPPALGQTVILRATGAVSAWTR